MGMEHSSELFTISVNGVLYLQVCGAVPAMQEVLGGWQVFRVTLGIAPSDILKCWCWLKKSQALGPVICVGGQISFRPYKNLMM